MGKLKDLNPHAGEIVNIKFKTINEIMSDSKEDFHSTEETYCIGDNVKAYMTGGHFLVKEALDINGNEDEGDHSIDVVNHYDCVHLFTVYEDAIESIEIIDVGERFESKDHKILVVRVEDEIFINGQPLIWNEVKEKKKYTKNNTNGEYENSNRKLLKMFENYIADMALKESFNAGEEV